MKFGLSMVSIVSFDFSSQREGFISGGVLCSANAVSEDKKESLELKKYIPSTCINNCIGISKFIKNCLFECCSNSMQIPLTQLYLAVGCSDYTLLFTLFGKMKNNYFYKSETERSAKHSFSFC